MAGTLFVDRKVLETGANEVTDKNRDDRRINALTRLFWFIMMKCKANKVSRYASNDA